MYFPLHWFQVLRRVAITTNTHSDWKRVQLDYTMLVTQRLHKTGKEEIQTSINSTSISWSTVGAEGISSPYNLGPKLSMTQNFLWATPLGLCCSLDLHWKQLPNQQQLTSLSYSDYHMYWHNPQSMVIKEATNFQIS
jgi:hypothetical protein